MTRATITRAGRILGCAMALACMATPLRAASLRTQVALAGPDVVLSDLFDDAGPEAARILGPGPAPGNMIVVEAAQLGAIARQFDVDWRPASSADRAVISRPGKPLPQDTVMAALHAALPGAGAPADGTVSLAIHAPLMLPAEAVADAAVEQISYDAPSGRFTAQLVVTAPNMAPLHQSLSGHVEDMRTLPVPTHRVAVGEIIGADDVRMARVPARLVRQDPAHAPAEAVGMAARHVLMPGLPIAIADLARPVLVHRGQIVMIALAVPGLSLSAKGEAMDDGALGESVRVRNTLSRAILQAEVTGPGELDVEPGTPPLHVQSDQWALR